MKSLDTIKKELEKDLDRCAVLADAWSAVTRNRKKDGKDFSVMSKNFSGCSFSDNQYSFHTKEKIIRVCKWSALQGYMSDEMKTTETLSPYKKDNYPEDETRIITSPGLCPYYFFNADEIENKIRERVEYFRKAAAEARADLAVIDTVFQSFQEAIDTAYKTMSGKVSAHTAYKCREYMQNYFPLN